MPEPHGPVSPEDKAPGEITLLLARTQQGDREAEAKLIATVYGELRKLAVAYLRRERPDHILQPTALVNEAYLKLADLNRLRWQDRSHFFGVAARLMRQILVDHARARRAEKRGGDVLVVPISKALVIDHRVGKASDVLAINEALEALARKDPRAVKVIECRFFAGLSIEETAEALGVAIRTVKRDWQIGRAWLRRELSRSARS
jgi:RNA polymerase sigma factor (TIGR02999 family)